MAYKVGQVVCLWQEHVETLGNTVNVTVLREVLVTVTETKTGAPGEFSREPVSGTSLRGIGDDGKVYEKHWNSWPESQTNCFTDQWSLRDDGEGADRFWYPKEAVHAYNSLRRAEKQAPTMKFERLDKKRQPILPKGDVEHCEKHDRYSHKDVRCLTCILDERKAA